MVIRAGKNGMKGELKKGVKEEKHKNGLGD